MKYYRKLEEIPGIRVSKRRLNFANYLDKEWPVNTYSTLEDLYQEFVKFRKDNELPDLKKPRVAVYNLMRKLLKQGKVERVRKGVYKKLS